MHRATARTMLGSMVSLRCLIVDDSLPFLRSARALLERGGVTVVGVATTGDEALRRAVELEPDSCSSMSTSVTRAASSLHSAWCGRLPYHHPG